MPEGHTVHRLATAFDALFHGEPLTVSSPQGRFADGAARVDARALWSAQAYGKQLFLGFAASGVPVPDADLLWLRVHLGLYGAWTFAGDGSTGVAHAIGAPRRRVGESEQALGPAVFPPAPRGQVRARLLGAHAVADLTGPTACEVVTDDERLEIVARLGPDPLRADADPQRFVDRVRRSRTPVGVQLMNQAVVAGVGNIYRAEALFRARLDPATPGGSVPAEVLRGIWEDLVELMGYGVRHGAIVTTRPEDRGAGHDLGPMRPHRVRQNTDGEPGAVPAGEAFYVYHRDGLACRVCGSPVLVREVAGRNLFWCPTCQV